jgi:hypothetical protein
VCVPELASAPVQLHAANVPVSAQICAPVAPFEHAHASCSPGTQLGTVLLSAAPVRPPQPVTIETASHPSHFTVAMPISRTPAMLIVFPYGDVLPVGERCQGVDDPSGKQLKRASRSNRVTALRHRRLSR